MNKASIMLFSLIGVLLIGVLFFIANGSLGLSFIPQNADGIVKVVSKQERISGELIITEENINHGSEYLTTDICRPIISGFADTGFEQMLNDSIENQITLAAKKAEQDASTFWEDTKAKGYEPWAYVFYAGYEAKGVSGIFSLKVTTFLNTGGTGMPHTIYYNADIKRSKLICLDDLFLKDSAYKEIIDGIILKEMDKDPERFFVRFTGITKNTQFFIFEGALYITFAKYEIASGMTGEPEFMIPADTIQELLAPEYKSIIK